MELSRHLMVSRLSRKWWLYRFIRLTTSMPLNLANAQQDCLTLLWCTSFIYASTSTILQCDRSGRGTPVKIWSQHSCRQSWRAVCGFVDRFVAGRSRCNSQSIFLGMKTSTCSDSPQMLAQHGETSRKKMSPTMVTILRPTSWILQTVDEMNRCNEIKPIRY